MNQGKLYIISAPSGAGKTSLVKKLLSEMQQLSVSVSHTTRAMREGEQHGKDYFFISVDEFKKMKTQHDFLEYAQVFDNFYGTSKLSVTENLNQGIDVILEIDWQGAQQIRTMMPNCQSIFILPPSIEVLQQRLESRGQDSEEVIARRMKDSVTEMSHHHEFDYLIVNDDFEQALLELKSIILSHRLQKSRQQTKLNPLLNALCDAG
ncbi:MAG: guanylate kinase [Methylococcaceae bacterium]|nr:guanylate kinase [Methylococcaceae bacterium]